jgi:transposase-like protein
MDLLIKSEVHAMSRVLRKYNELDEARDMAETCVLEAVQNCPYDILLMVKDRVKKKLAGLTVDEAVKEIQSESQSAYKAIAKDYLGEALDSALS